MVNQTLLQIIEEVLRRNKQYAKYYYKWQWIEQLIKNGVFRGLFVDSSFINFFHGYNGGFTVKKRKYKKHWNRPIWKTIRQYRLYLDDYKCVYCSSTVNLQCHHRSYENLDTDREIQDCITVCFNCHQSLHGFTPKPKGKKYVR